ncbi:MAG: VWA domain-containing protein [Acidobacteriaceae bacterium]
MRNIRRPLSIALLLAAGFAFAHGQSSANLPSAPIPQIAPPPPPPAPAVEKKPGPPAFEDLYPRNPVSAQAQSTPSAASNSSNVPPNKASAPAVVQQQNKTTSAPAQDEPYKFTTESREVDVVFTVTDKHGRFVRNLTAGDIHVLDNKQPPQRVVNFSAQTDLPLRVGLLIDASGSIRERFKFEQEAASEFMASIIRPSRDQAFILGFDSSPEITQDFTSDTALLAKGVRMLRPGGGTALYDAIYDACRHKLWHTGDREPVRKAIIVVSDGDDNQSTVTREQAIEMAQRAEVIIYTISTNNSGTFLKGDNVLGQIASATGGRAFYPFKIEDLSNAFSDVQEELRSQYSIAYVPADFARDGSFHTIDIQVNEKKYKARARRGYFAQHTTQAMVSPGGHER